MRRIVAGIVMSVCTGFTAWGQVPPPVGVTPPAAEAVSVSGVGKVRLTPDRVSFTVGVESVAPTVEEATKKNNEKISQVIAALKQAGAKDPEIQTTNFSVIPQQEFPEGKRPRVTGYQVTNSVTVTRDKTTDASSLLQAAVSVGANQVSGLSFTVADQVRGRSEGLQAAFEDARAKAQVLAQAAGRSLGRVIAISEGGASVPPPIIQRSLAMKAETLDVPVEQGTEELSFTVMVSFELR